MPSAFGGQLAKRDANRIFSLCAVSILALAAPGIRAQELAKPLPPWPVITTELPVISRPLSATSIVVNAPAKPPAPHTFWDSRNRTLFAAIAVFRGMDYASTRNMQARGREEMLLPDEVANNSAGFASLEAAGTAASVGISYWMHRAGHHRLERWISVVHIGVTGFGVVRNYSLESRHPAPAVK
jgi:hypothetical protein